MLDIDPTNPNMHVVDILRKLPAIKMTIKEDTGFFTEEEMVNKLVTLKHEGSAMFGVLIIPPDK